jgi:cytoskeletal protein CcmA (bactofilin family)
VFGKRKIDEPAPAKPQTAPPAPEAVRAEPEAPPEETSPADAPVTPDFKETPMARSPFAPPPIPAAPTAPTPVPARATITSTPAREVVERRTLVVGRGISVQGTVQDAERLVVEGTVEASMIHATELAVSPGGMFKGEIEVEDAEIAGTISGTLTARGGLIIRASGRVMGSAHCRRLQVEEGGQISGQMEMLTDGAKPEPVRVAHETAV